MAFLADHGTFTLGDRELCKNLGYKLAVLSGGFIPLANYVKSELGLDYAYANQVCFHLLWILLLTK